MTKFCNKCSAAMGDDDKICPSCGAAIEETANDRQSYNKKQEDLEALKKEPLTFGNYLLLFLVLAIPVVNIIFLLIWAFGKEQNVNRKNFSKAALVYIAGIGLLAVLVIGGIFGIAAYSMMHYEDVRHYQYVYGEQDDDWDIWTHATPFHGHGYCINGS